MIDLQKSCRISCRDHQQCIIYSYRVTSGDIKVKELSMHHITCPVQEIHIVRLQDHGAFLGTRCKEQCTNKIGNITFFIFTTSKIIYVVELSKLEQLVHSLAEIGGEFQRQFC